jgi:hypothetical protein
LAHSITANIFHPFDFINASQKLPSSYQPGTSLSISAYLILSNFSGSFHTNGGDLIVNFNGKEEEV